MQNKKPRFQKQTQYRVNASADMKLSNSKAYQTMKDFYQGQSDRVLPQQRGQGMNKANIEKW